ncbi:N-acetyltransferase eco [Scaptodrosophila lebanonensis]|uniref:N-acetyltransferase eco n=1 Tax=Drosophila lebanonensis TaxID=7225 RepID=A0A6J2TEJ7_DROLE|nr:N-acetyltransferase eco [Scaptodrosophila lebanonensis]
METQTPTRSGRPTRTATPRLSERKKQLFRSRSSTKHDIEEDSDADDPLRGISPLTPTKSGANEHNKKNAQSVSIGSRKSSTIIDEGRRRLRSSTSSSPENNKENKVSLKTRGVDGAATGASADQLPSLFTTTMRINSNSSSANNSPRTPKTPARHIVSDSDESDDGNEKMKTVRRCTAIKRKHSPRVVNLKASPESASGSPQSKQSRLQKQCIPTMSFYSKGGAGLTSPDSPRSSRTSLSSAAGQQYHQQSSNKGKVISPTTRRRVGINKGVRHKIRKPPRTAQTKALPPTDVDLILKALRNDKLRLLITKNREERAKIEEVHEILRKAKDPIQMAKPLSIMASDDANNNNNNITGPKENFDAWQPTTTDFSDLSDCEECEETGVPDATSTTTSELIEPVIPIIRHDAPGTRKFFKSGRRSSTCMEVRITDNIRASVSNGKIALVEPKKVRRVRVRSTTHFSMEQATVDAILRNLDDTTFGDSIQSSPEFSAPTVAHEPEVVMDADPFAKYRQLLPYNTNDPAVIEQQELLLEFLISNDICTDENFKIFIADPDNHKDEATRIVDELYVVVNAEQMAEEMCVEENVPVNIVPVEQPESHIAVTAVETQPKLFPIFTQERVQPLPQRSTRRKAPASMQLSIGASGSNQMQIDAGQKAFGAKQCQQCGLVYTVHEPEEEQLHREYHNSVHVLRFKGWIDEDIVAVYTEWANDGRIIRLTEQAPAVRLERLNELIKLVDKELGYASYIVPKTFVAFFAVRKQQIVGMCLVQPLTQAHRFMQIDGIDYCSEEAYEASCGISRIWVSPLQRRRRIATKLLRAVQLHTILGREIPMNRIAFSSPTDDGRIFARQVTQCDNFLTY